MIEGILALLAAMGASIAFLLKSRSTHKQRAERAEKQKDEVISHVTKANEVDRVVSNEPDPVKRLREEWSRD